MASGLIVKTGRICRATPWSLGREIDGIGVALAAGRSETEALRPTLMRELYGDYYSQLTASLQESGHCRVRTAVRDSTIGTALVFAPHSRTQAVSNSIAQIRPQFQMPQDFNVLRNFLASTQLHLYSSSTGIEMIFSIP